MSDHPVFANFEKDLGVQFGRDNYDTLVRVSDFVKAVRGSSEHMSEVAPSSGGPSVLALVHLAHSAGKVLVLGLADPDPDGDRQITNLTFL